MSSDTNSTKNIEKQLRDMYQRILKREPDKGGLYYFVIQIKNKKLTLEDVEKDLLVSDEAKYVTGEWSHYTDSYWNDLDMVIKYKNKLATGDENIQWMDDIQQRFKDYLPFDNN